MSATGTIQTDWLVTAQNYRWGIADKITLDEIDIHLVNLTREISKTGWSFNKLTAFTLFVKHRVQIMEIQKFQKPYFDTESWDRQMKILWSPRGEPQ